MNSAEQQVNNEIANFKNNVSVYEKLYQKLYTETNGNLGIENTKILLSLKTELLTESQDILTKINTIDNSQTNSPGITNPASASALMRNKGDVYDLIELMNNTNLKAQEQIQIRYNLVGSLEDSKLRYDSINIYYLIYTFIAIVATSLLVNAFINRNSSGFGDILLIIVCIIAVIYGGKYVFDKFIN
jgi:hypothetical protein